MGLILFSFAISYVIASYAAGKIHSPPPGAKQPPKGPPGAPKPPTQKSDSPPSD